MSKVTGHAPLAAPHQHKTPNLETATNGELQAYFDELSFNGPKFPFNVKPVPFSEMPKACKDAFAALIEETEGELEAISRYAFASGRIGGQRAYFASMNDGGAFAVGIASESGRVVYNVYGQDDGD